MNEEDRDFGEDLRLGKIVEEIVAAFLRSRGYFVTDVCALPAPDHAGPRTSTASESIILADLDCSKEGKRVWVETKGENVSAFNERLEEFVHGIRATYWPHYNRLSQVTGTPVWLVFLEVKAGKLLMANISTLDPIPCMHRKCGPRCLVYFTRKSFEEIHQFSDDQMVEVRLAFTEAEERREERKLERMAREGLQ